MYSISGSGNLKYLNKTEGTISRKQISEQETLEKYGIALYQGIKRMKANDVENDYYRKEKELLIKLIVDQMPEQRKRIFMMSRYQGLSNDQIAKSLGLSKHTIENNISLALKELREVMLAFIIFLLN